ncbi:MAG: acyltransferase [Alphaproteobacteria bacterium]|nr:acyltransferase [Alphaproteobacteria bacterium]
MKYSDYNNKNLVVGGKNPTISFIRLLSMCSIIACHFCQYYESEWAWWLNVGVQIFFILSGYLYGNKTIEEPIGWYKKQLIKILVPYYIFLVPVIILYTIASPDSLNIVNVFRSLFAVGTIKGIGHLWFVSAILFCYFVTPYLAAFRDYISQKIVGKQLILLLALFCIVSIVGVFTNGFTPGNICCYMLGYFMAVYVKRYGEKVIKISFILSLLPCIVSNAIYIFLKYVNGIDMQGIFSHVTLYSHMFLAFSIVTLLMITFGNIKKRRIYEWSDNYSYEVYIVH